MLIFRKPKNRIMVEKNLAISYAIIAFNGLMESGFIKRADNSKDRNLSTALYSAMDILMKANRNPEHQMKVLEEAIELIQNEK